jgi:hypothetical protein
MARVRPRRAIIETCWMLLKFELESLDSLCRTRTQREIEAALGAWLGATSQRLEAEDSSLAEARRGTTNHGSKLS